MFIMGHFLVRLCRLPLFLCTFETLMDLRLKSRQVQNNQMGTENDKIDIGRRINIKQCRSPQTIRRHNAEVAVSV